MPKAKVSCAYCHKEFEKYASASGKTRYCSHKCYSNSKRRHINIAEGKIGKDNNIQDL